MGRAQEAGRSMRSISSPFIAGKGPAESVVHVLRELGAAAAHLHPRGTVTTHDGGYGRSSTVTRVR